MNNVIVATLMMLVTGALLGLLLGVAEKYLAVPVDERVETVKGLLPNYNCGACGYAGCSDMAEAMVGGTVKSAKACKTIKADAAQKIVDYLTTTPGPDGNPIADFKL